MHKKWNVDLHDLRRSSNQDIFGIGNEQKIIALEGSHVNAGSHDHTSLGL